jgi:hypothetical protein
MRGFQRLLNGFSCVLQSGQTTGLGLAQIKFIAVIVRLAGRLATGCGLLSFAIRLGLVAAKNRMHERTSCGLRGGLAG